MTWLAAFGLTLAVEVPLYVLGLRLLDLAGRRRAVALAVGVNLLTHPPLWWWLAPRPSAAELWSAEVVVCLVEAAVLAAAIRKDRPLALVLSVGVNAVSLLIGLLVA